MTENQAREEICRVGRSLFERGYVHGTAGNISVQLPESDGGGHLITPTDACLGFLHPARLARLDASGQQLSGDRGSKTMALHRAIYRPQPTPPGPPPASSTPTARTVWRSRCTRRHYPRAPGPGRNCCPRSPRIS
jgi:hypothetical protein